MLETHAFSYNGRITTFHAPNMIQSFIGIDTFVRHVVPSTLKVLFYLTIKSIFFANDAIYKVISI